MARVISYATVLTLASAISAGACTRADSADASSVVRHDSADIQIVESSRPRWSDGDGWRIDSTPLLAIGASLHGDPEEQFMGIAGLTRSSDGRIVVLSGAELRIFGADGRHISTTGREGQGPGEYDGMTSLRRLPGDSLVVMGGLFAIRAGMHAPDGRFVRMLELPRVGRNGRTATLEHRFPDGASLVRAGGIMVVQPRSGTWTDSLTYYRVDVGSDSAVLFMRIPGPWFSGNGVDVASVGYAPRSMLVTHGDRVYVGYPESFEIAEFASDGRLVRLIRRRWEPVPVDAAAREAYLRRTYGASPSPIEQRYIAVVTYADHHPAYDDLRVDASGNLWARLPRLDDEALASRQAPAAPVRWSVFDSSGVWLGSVTTPAGLEVREIGDDFVLGTWRDADDVSHVRMHRIAKPR